MPKMNAPKPRRKTFSFQKWLITQGACEEARKWVGRKTIETAWNMCPRSDWMEWLVSRLPYEAVAPARKAYDEAYAAAWKTYNEVVAAAWKAYDEAVAPARKAYDEALAAAWKTYDEALAAAWKAYDEAVAAAWKAYAEAVAPARKAFDEATAAAWRKVLPTKQLAKLVKATS